VTSKSWIVALVAGGLLLICMGFQQRQADRAPKQTVTQFLDAIQTGDRRIATRLMTRELRQQTRDNADRFDAAWGTESSDDGQLSWELKSLKVDGGSARAEALFSHRGMQFVNTTLMLKRTRTGLWKVDRLDNRLNLAWRMLQNEQLARDLRDQLQKYSEEQVAETSSSESKRR